MLSLLLYLISSSLCLFSANMVKNNSSEIMDIIHDNIREISILYLSDFLVLIQTLFSVTLMNTEELMLNFLVMGIVQIFRSICTIVTPLPPLKKYQDKYRLGGLNGSGTEYIFSGHACYSALGAIFLYKHGIISPFPLVCYNIISQFLIVATRNHYTIDVILAWIITPLTYANVVLCKNSESCSRYLTLVN
jgi:hypothetical protein